MTKDMSSRTFDTFALRQISRHLEIPFAQLRPYETLLGYDFNDDDTCATVTFEVFEVIETIRETRIKSRLVRTLMFHRPDANSQYKFGLKFEEPDDDFVPVIHHNIGKIFTFMEWRAQRNFERDCFRPGNDSFPLESYDVTIDSPVESVHKLAKHWKV